MKYLISVVLAIGFCVLFCMTAHAGNLNTSGKCPTLGTCTLGHAGTTSFTIVTDGGTVTLDGTVSAKMKLASAASGTLSPNLVTLLTAEADYTIPDCSNATIGNWYTVIVRDANETASLLLADSSDIINFGGITPAAGEQLDSPTKGNTTAGTSVTLVCGRSNNYYSTKTVGLWVDAAP
jgi:hypothetical protein